MEYFYNNGELYHARSHLYTKREWKNGHWIYWYNKGPDKFHTYPRHEGYTGKLVQTKDKKGKVLTEHVKTNKTDRSPSGHKRDMQIWSAVEEKNFNADKNFLKRLNDQQRFKNISLKDREFTIKEVEKTRNISGRNMAAYKQELSRLESAENKKIINRAKIWVNSLFNKK